MAHPISRDRKSMETEAMPCSEFSNGGKAIVEQMLASEERKKSKRAGLLESQSGLRVQQVYQCHLNRLASPYDGC